MPPLRNPNRPNPILRPLHDQKDNTMTTPTPTSPTVDASGKLLIVTSGIADDDGYYTVLVAVPIADIQTVIDGAQVRDKAGASHPSCGVKIATDDYPLHAIGSAAEIISLWSTVLSQKLTSANSESRRWHIATAKFSDGGKSISGPYSTIQDAVLAREAIENRCGDTSYWIDGSDAAESS